MTRHTTLSKMDFSALLTATRALVDACGGVDAAASACRVQRSTLARYYAPNHPEMMPVDVAAALERVSGSSAVTLTLARLSRHALVPLHGDEGEPELLRRLGELMRRVGAACSEGAEAMDDGVLTGEERARLSTALHDVVNTASALTAWLCGPGFSEGESS